MMRRLYLIVLFMCSMQLRGQVPLVFGINFVVPMTSSNVDGNAFSAIPFVAHTVRYQQVYAASQFFALTNYGGGWMSEILFRGDATNGEGVSVKIPNLQVNLSTTQRGPDELSPAFAENIGADDKVVFSGYLQASGGGGHRAGPEAFSFWIHLSNLFFYNPAFGNLLLDMTILQGDTNNAPIGNFLDACNTAGDSVSRVYWGSATASTGLVDTVGLVTWLSFWPNPRLVAQKDTNSVALAWPANPNFFVLQSNANLSAQSQWQTVTEGIETVSNGYVKTFNVPLDSAGKEAYFRLLSTEALKPP